MSARAKQRPFVKAADTTVAPEKSRMELERMLTRYGAVGFSYAVNREEGTVRVEFVVPDSNAKGAPRIPVRLPIDVRRVYRTLHGRPMKGAWEEGKYVGQVYDPNGYNENLLAQAERVAWRNLLLWVDAALSAASVGMQTISEAFFAHTLVTDETGRVERMADYVERSGGALAPGVRALLPGARDR